MAAAHGVIKPPVHVQPRAAIADQRGQFGADLVEGFLSAGGGINRISTFSDLSLLSAMLDCLLSPDDLILVKGSRATRMERVLDVLKSLAHNATDDVRRAA